MTQQVELPFERIAGVDEAGRGPLAGPVVVAAVILNPQHPIDGLRDSKKISEKKRETLFIQIKQYALSYAIEIVTVEEIDQINILQATLKGMQRSVNALDTRPSRVLIDGNQAPKLDYPCQTIIQGDDLEPAISAASILAKVSRDRLMKQYHQTYPEYGFDRHKGYPTAAHMTQLREVGACPIHRRSFAPVKNALKEL